MKRGILSLILGGIVLVSSGCAGVGHYNVREDITDLTRSQSYGKVAKDFLDDTSMATLSKTPETAEKTESYCKSFSNELGQKAKAKTLAIVRSLDHYGFKGFGDLAGAFDNNKPTLDFKEREFFCRNFFEFTSSLTADEKRKLLIFLGDDFFSVNWMREKLRDEEFIDAQSRMMVKKPQILLVQDAGYTPLPSTGHSAAPPVREAATSVASFAEFTADEGGIDDGDDSTGRKYFRDRLEWQARNAGLAMLSWFQATDKDKELGLVNPASMDALKETYSLYRNTGFAWYTYNRDALAYKAVKRNVLSPNVNRRIPNSKEVLDVWGTSVYLSDNDSVSVLHEFFEKFPPSDLMARFIAELRKEKPSFAIIKSKVIESIPDATLKEVKNYARWLSEGKPGAREENDGK